MANPQKENGFTPIANEIMDQIILRDFTKRQRAILCFILRYTYGFNRKEVYVPKLSYFKICNIHPSDIKKELQQLVSLNVIEWDKENQIFALNKNFDAWNLKANQDFFEINKKMIEVNGTTEPRKLGKTPTKKPTRPGPIVGKIPSKNIRKLGKTPTKKAENLGKTPTKQPNKVGKTPTKQPKKLGKTPSPKKAELGKTPSENLVKHQQGVPSIPCGSKAQEAPKDIKRHLKNCSSNARDARENPHRFFMNNFSVTPSPHTLAEITSWIEDEGFQDGEELVLAAMKNALDHNVPKWVYVKRTLANWQKEGITTTERLEEKTNETRRGDQSTTTSSRSRTQKPGWSDIGPDPGELTPEEQRQAERELAKYYDRNI